MHEAVKQVEGADLDRVVNRLLERLIELESTKQSGENKEALRGVRANQLDARGNRGGIWYVVESKWSVIAFGVAMLALGVALMTSCVFFARWIETNRELATEKRLHTAAIDDLRMEFRAAVRSAGVQLPAIEDHDISQHAAPPAKGVKP